MKKLILLITLTASTLAFSVDKFTVVAVGKAALEKEKIRFSMTSKSTTFTKEEVYKFNQFLSTIKADFGFYKHMFDQISDEKSKDQHYKVHFEFVLFNKEIYTQVKVLNKRNVEVLNKQEKFWTYNVRRFAHHIADGVYQSIKGRPSVFKTKIYFVSDISSTSKVQKKELYEMDFDGGNRKRLTFNEAVIISPSVSTDATKITYTMIEDKLQRSKSGKISKLKNPNLYLMDLKTRKTKIISSMKGINSGAVFSADDKSLYLTLSDQKNADIYKMDLKSFKRKKITRHYSDDVDPHINKDGSMLTFLSGRSGRAMIYTLDPEGTEKSVKRISYVGRFNAAPRFSPDGKEIVFSSWVDNRFDIYRIGAKGNNLARLTKNFGSNEEAWFSPDGEFIVFTSQKVISRTKADQDIYIMNRDGEILKRLTKAQGKHYTPRWANPL